MSLESAEVNPATELFTRCIRQAIVRQLPIVELFNSTAELNAAGQKQLASDLYKAWIAYNPDNPLLYAVYFNFGIGLAENGDYPGGINAMRESIRLKPDFHAAYINLGRALEDVGQVGEAVGQWLSMVKNLSVVTGEAIAHKLTALQQTGRVLEGAYSDAPAEDALRQSLDISPHQPEVIQHWLSLRQRQCRWPVIEPWERVDRATLIKGMSSLSLCNLTDDPMFQLAKAYTYARHHIGMPKAVARGNATAPRRDPLRLRIGYVSSDLREHAVGFAMTDVIELHDRAHFEIFAYYCGISRTDATQARIKSAVDHWVDLNGMSDDDAAARIAADGIDILIDLNGYTKDARTKVFARKPAPIAVNWFGYPNTMGTPYHNYLIADSVIVPPEDEIYYSEKIARLPCYQPNDRKRVVASRQPSRAEAGLPEDAMVYCCLNGMQKITPRVYQRWLTILGQVPNSVLWLLTGTPETNDRMRQIAAASGIAPERIVFADKMANPEHLARYPLADLFLDSFPYGAHTTASDSLWMGVPILTLMGRSFPARVCASLVNAAGIGEMACATPEMYVARAIELGLDRVKIGAIRGRLAAARDTCLLFDTPNLVRHLEDLYRQMWSDLIRGALPAPQLRNLEIYHEIGAGLALEDVETLSDEGYRALYAEKLQAWHDVYAIDSDRRLWRDSQPEAPSNVTRLAVA